jgi:hypothetical protein
MIREADIDGDGQVIEILFHNFDAISVAKEILLRDVPDGFSSRSITRSS